MLKKGDFIELKFVGRIAESGEVFDTNIEEEAEKAGLQKPSQPSRICIGEGMIIKGLDEALEGIEEEQEHEILLRPRDAFGERNSSLVKTISLSAFVKKGMTPVRGELVSFDGIVARIAAISGARVIVDFNHPLAGKVIIYRIRAKKIEDVKEKLAALASFYLATQIKTENIKIEGKKAILEVEKLPAPQVISTLKQKTTQLLDVELELQVKEEEKAINKQEK